MRPEVLKLLGDCSDDARIDRAVRVLEGGGLVAFPTDTVYGLGADASRPEAVERLYEVKGRDRAKPFARLVPDSRTAAREAPFWPRLARKLARACWPGSLTIVVVGEGFRVPAHRAARALAARVKGGLVATSANRSGHPDPRTAREVVDFLGAEVGLVLDGGEVRGVASTVVRVNGPRLKVLRKGAIPGEELEVLAPLTVLFVCRGNTCRSPLAAASFRAELEARRRTDVVVLSAGLDVIEAEGASRLAREAAAEAGLDLSGHATTALTSALLARADRVFVMERSQTGKIAPFLPQERLGSGEEAGHIALLDPAGEEIADPAGGEVDDYRLTLDRIRSAVGARAREILGGAPHPREGAAA